LVNAARLKLMRPGGVVLNFARAQIVNEADIVAALGSGHLLAYVCDFPSNALRPSRAPSHCRTSAPRRGGGRQLRGDGRRSAA